MDCAKVKGPCLILVGTNVETAGETLGRAALRVQDTRGVLAQALGYQPPRTALYVIKGNARPRLAQYEGELNDRPALKKFLSDLQEGQLTFERFSWPEHGNRNDKSQQIPDDSDAPVPPSPATPRGQAELSSGQYVDSDAGFVEVIELEDDE